MDPEPLVVRSARPGDLPAVLELLAAAGRWAAGRGEFNPWPDPFPEAIVRPNLERGELYVAERPAVGPIATITLQWSDPKFWGVQPPVAGYVHRFAIDRRWAGQGLGDRLLDWAAAQSVARGRDLLRLDCSAENQRLHTYYRSRGFHRVGTVELEGRSFALWERPLDPAGRAGTPKTGTG